MDMKTLFVPGCALNEYKPGLIEKIKIFLTENKITNDIYLTCCKKTKPSDESIKLILCCPGCESHFRELYPNGKIVSLWSVLLDAGYPFPDYKGERMSIHDSCRTRGRYSEEMQVSARELCKEMNIIISEPERSRDRTVCCGAGAPDIEARKYMARKRAQEFPKRDVVVYCTGCARSFSVTDIRPRHLLDLLFKEPLTELGLKES